jgi:type IV secretory pathway TraG/TraD family ATPase VirD4
MPGKGKEVRQLVNGDPVGQMAILSAKLAIWGGLCIFSALIVSSRTLYPDYLGQPPYSVSGNIIWSLKLHFPALKNASIGTFSVEYWPTYIALVCGLAAFSYVSWLLCRAEIQAGRQLLDAAGRIDAKIPRLEEAQRGAFAGKYGGKILWSSIEDRALVVGPPGTGKTTFLINQILRSAEQKRDFIAVDIKPELADILRRDLKEAGYIVIEINPVTGTDKRYNPLSDIYDDSGIFEFCESLIPTLGSDNNWVKAEQAYFRLALLYLRYKNLGETDMCSLPAAYQLIGRHKSAEDFLRTVSKSTHMATRQSAEKMLDKLDSSKPAQAGFGSVFDRLNWLALDAVSHTLSKSDFSLQSIGRSKKPVALFLKFEETCLGTMGGLLSALYGHILGTLIKTSKERRPVMLYLDEIGNIPPISGLTAKLNTIRSRGLPTWMYWQSTQQMEAYGSGAREVFFGSADMQIFFRSNDLNTMQTVEKLAGKITVAKHTQSSGGGTLSSSVTSERVDRIEGAELGELRPGEVITLYKGSRWRGEATPHYVDFISYKR